MFAPRRKDAFEVKHSNKVGHVNPKSAFEHVQNAQSDQQGPVVQN